MKVFGKILLLSLLTVCFANLAFARVDKAAGTDYVQLVSHTKRVIDRQGELEYDVIVNFCHNQTNMGSEGLKNYYNMSIIANNYDKVFTPVMVFNFNKPPKLEIVSGGKSRTVTIPKTGSQVWAGGLSHEPDQALREQILAAEQLTIVMPYEDGSEYRLTLPNETLQEWKYVINADMSAEHRALMG